MNPWNHILVLVLFASACTVEADDDTGQSSTTSGTTTTGNSGSSTTSTGSSMGGVESCVELCNLAPVDIDTAYCVAEFITRQGYDTSDPQCDTAGTNTPSGCLACYDAIAVTDADCVAAYGTCF